jgi:hypothetical protein
MVIFKPYVGVSIWTFGEVSLNHNLNPEFNSDDRSPLYTPHWVVAKNSGNSQSVIQISFYYRCLIEDQ